MVGGAQAVLQQHIGQEAAQGLEIDLRAALCYTDYRGQFEVLIRLKSHLYQHHVDCVSEGEDHGQEEDTEEITPAHPHEAGGGGGGKDDDGDEAYDDDDADLLLAVQSKE